MYQILNKRFTLTTIGKPFAIQEGEIIAVIDKTMTDDGYILITFLVKVPNPRAYSMVDDG